jgi:ribosomal protein S6--L-glutamate ligase
MPGEFRANIHLGGTASIIKPTAEEKRIIKAAKAMDLKVAGVDIIRSSKVLIIEVNSSQTRRNRRCTTKILQGEMIKAIEKNFKHKI